MKKVLLPTLLTLSLPVTATADVIGAKIGAGVWDHEPSGTIESTTDSASTDLAANLGLESDQENYFYVAVEHPVPLLPNVKIQKTALTNKSSTPGTANFTFNGNTYTGGVGTASLTLDQTDYILYWELLDNVVSLDIGINAKQVDGEAVLDGDTTTFSGTVPMGYAALELAFPGTSLSLAAEISAAKLGDSEISDTVVKLNYDMVANLGLELGMRTQTVKLSDLGGINSNMKFDGIFAGLYLDF